MRILVTGSRDWADQRTLSDALFDAFRELLDRDPARLYVSSDWTLVHGDCPTGADRMAAIYARSMGWTVEPHPADWTRHGAVAGLVRNREMVDLGADVCVACIGDCTSPRCGVYPHGSHGASHCAGLAEKAGIPVRRYTPEERTIESHGGEA